MTQIYIAPIVQALRDLHRQIHRDAPPGERIADYLTRQAHGIVAAHAAGNDAVTFHLACWCPDMIGQPRDQIMSAPLQLAQAHSTVAREHGYADWNAALNANPQTLDAGFETALEQMLAGDLTALRQSLASQPDLARARSGFGHRATLLHYLGANGVESHRQVTPLNAVELTQCLLQAGADANASANIYGASTPLALVTSSAHPAAAGLTDDIANALKRAGAR